MPSVKMMARQGRPPDSMVPLNTAVQGIAESQCLGGGAPTRPQSFSASGGFSSSMRA